MVKCQELELMFSLAVYPSQSDITNLESNIFNAIVWCSLNRQIFVIFLNWLGKSFEA